MKRQGYLLTIVSVIILFSQPSVASEEKLISEAQPADRNNSGLSLQTPSLLVPYVDNQTASRAVDRNISLFASRIKDRFALYLSRSGKYIEIMKDILRKKDVPEDIVFL
jgi:membrane-bound lytic murein transglycosylase D